jgi:tRNA(fMet)-specific endonuclease VapC
MKFMLDTDICIYLIKKKPKKVIDRLLRHDVSDVCMSSITLSELEFGVAKSGQPQRNKLALLEFAAPLEVMPYDDDAAKEYGYIRAHLEKRGRPLGALDTLIAAHARALGVTLVSNNQREFKRVPGLKTVNWAK